MLEKFKGIRVTPREFYNLGVIVFGIIALMNTASFVTNITNNNYLTIFAVIGAGAMLIFNYAIFGFFYYLKSTLPPKDLKKGTLKDMEELMKEEGGTKK